MKGTNIILTSVQLSTEADCRLQHMIAVELCVCVCGLYELIIISPSVQFSSSPTRKSMATLSTDRKPPLDYGVQIRFIKDLHDTGGGYPEKTRGGSGAMPPSNKYGVAVRVQGISGQPYVVLKDGEKGDSYGVQLKSQQAQSQNPNSGLSSPYNSLPQRKKGGDVQSPYTPIGQRLSSPVSPEDEGREHFGSPFKRPPGDGQAGSQREGEGGPRMEGQVEEEEKVRVKIKEEPGPTAAEPYRLDMERGWVNREEFNEAGLKPVSPRGARQNGVGLGGSLGRNGLYSSFPEPPPPVSFNEEPVPAIDKTSLAPINKLISKFNIGTPTGQTRGRSGTRLRLKFDERRRSRSLDACKEVRPAVSPPSPTPNTASSLLSSTSSSTSSTPPYSSLGMSPASVAKVTALPGPKPSFIKSPGKLVVKDTPPAIPLKKTGMPAPLKGQSVEVISGEEPQTKQAIYTIMKEGTSESDVSIERKGNLVYETTSSAKGPPKPGAHGNLRKELEQRLNENLQLQEQLDRNKTELQLAQEELTQLRMAREGSESRVRKQEDQLAELQEVLRGMPENTPQTDSMSLQTDVMLLQADLAEAAMLRKRQEEVLRQRERELMALKGALKEEVGSHDQEMETLREQYSKDMETLKTTMEQVSQSQQQIEEERQRVNDSMLCLEEELESCRDQGGQWREQLETTTEELHSTKQELMRARLEKEEFEGELKELQDSLMSMKKQMPGFDEADSYVEDLQRCHGDIKQARTELDRQKVELNEKEEELQALIRASQVRESELRSEIDRLKDQSRQEKDALEMALEKAKQPSGGSSPLDQGSLELQEANTRLRERLTRMTRLHSSVPQSSEAEQALEDENRSLRSQLEEARRGASRLGKDRDELGQRLEERDLERDALRRGKSDLEEQKRLLDRALEKISKEMEVMLGDSRQSVQALQSQLDEYRERSRRDLQDAQRQGKDRLAELQRAQVNLKTLQEEVSRLKKELVVCGEERDSSQLERDLLCSRLKHLESELDSERSSQMDRNRELRGLEDKAKTMEIELDEEKNSVELLNDRVARSREQIDQLRGDLMKERSTVHDLEMDKSVLERQVKELRSRVADMETQSRPSAGITLLEGKVQELEERLHSEEREKLSIQSSQRRVERKLKDIIVTLDQERNQHAEQRDQLSLRVKALKRQLDESEGEVERLEGVRRKALRDLEEQQELQEALQAKVTALESEKRKVYQTRRPVLGSSSLSSEDEDSFYDNSITSFLTEGQLHTTNC